MASIGEELKRERELRGISLKEIADGTRINIRFLRHLEQEQFSLLPGKFFIKGIIRSYANYIGLDEDAILNTYFETVGHQKQEEENQLEEAREPKTHLPQRTKNIIMFAAVFIGILVVLSALHFILRNGGPPPTIPASMNQVSEKKNTVSPPQPIMKEIPEVVEEMDLELSFHQETWIQVFADGELSVDGIKQPGETARVKAKDELLIHLGNAGGLTYRLNKKEGKSFGLPGQVIKNVRITLENMDDYVERTEETETEGSEVEIR